MKTVDIQDATAPLADYARKASKEVVLVTRRGRPVAAVIDAAHLDEESIRVSTNPEFLAILERSRAQARAGDVVPLSEIRRQLGPKRRRRRAKSKSS